MKWKSIIQLYLLIKTFTDLEAQRFGMMFSSLLKFTEWRVACFEHMISVWARVVWNVETRAVQNVDFYCEFSCKNDPVKRKNWFSDPEKRRTFTLKMLM